MLHPMIVIFAEAYWEWQRHGAINNETFSRREGLCHLFMRFAREDMAQSHALVTIKRQFRDDGLDEDFPFYKQAGRAGLGEYYHEVSERIMHVNPNRLQWIRSILDREEIPYSTEPVEIVHERYRL